MLALPVGFLALTYASRHLFYHAGVWYEPGPAGYVVIRPPIGVPVSALPPDYSTVWAGNRPYYYANETYYQRAANGYVVVNPPATGTYVEAPQAAPPVPMLPPVPKPAAGTWYFCHSSNTYYPYVPTCPEGFQAVPAAPTPGR